MKTDFEHYLVGGAVRDTLMGRTPKDRDYVVIGETVESMRKRGFMQVGADFPVFLHPDSKEEYALARTERKSGATRLDFTTDIQGVSLVDDLERRDLTINAMAMADDGSLIDPFGGRADLNAKTLRHVGPAFAEDPLRVLRVARFAAQTGFQIAPETVKLCQSLAAAGELSTLTPERISGEMIKALKAPHRSRFFTALDEMGALDALFPEVAALKGQTQPYAHHEEGDAFVHTMAVIDASPAGDPLMGFCALTHDLGKGLTPKDMLPHHHGRPATQDKPALPGHEEAGAPLALELASRLRMSSEYGRLAAKSAKWHGHVAKVAVMRPATFVRIFDENGGITRLADLSVVARLSHADYEGRQSEHVRAYPDGGRRNAEVFVSVMEAISKVRVSQFLTPDQMKEMTGDHIKVRLHQARVVVAKQHLNALKPTTKVKDESLMQR